MNRERILTALGYGAFFWFFFFLFAYWMFPYQRLAAFLSDKVSESGSGYTLEIGGIAPYWLTGVELEDVKVRKAAAEVLAAPPPGTGKDKATLVDQSIKVRTAHARMGLLSLLFGDTALSFAAELEAGELEGTYDDDGDEKHVVARLEKVDLAKLGLLESLVSLPLTGMLTGDFNLTLAPQAAKTSGKINLTVQKLTAGDGKAKLKLGSMGGAHHRPHRRRRREPRPRRQGGCRQRAQAQLERAGPDPRRQRRRSLRAAARAHPARALAPAEAQ